MALRHSNKVVENEPQWGDVDKTALPRIAFADMGEEENKSTWKYPHHWVDGGTEKDDRGVWVDGKLYLHRGGLIAAWAAAHGARSGEEASEEVIAHLAAHRKALGMDAEEEATNADTQKTAAAVVAADASSPATDAVHSDTDEVQASRQTQPGLGVMTFGSRSIRFSVGADGEYDTSPPRIDIVAYTGQALDFGRDRVVIDLAGLAASNPVVLLREHDPMIVVGHVEEVYKDANTLRVAGVLSNVTSPSVQEILEAAKRGFPWRASVGLRVFEYARLAKDERSTINGVEYTGPNVVVITKSKLEEVSVVAIPADGKTSVRLTGSLAQLFSPSWGDVCDETSPPKSDACVVATASVRTKPPFAAIDAAESRIEELAAVWVKRGLSRAAAANIVTAAMDELASLEARMATGEAASTVVEEAAHDVIKRVKRKFHVEFFADVTSVRTGGEIVTQDNVIFEAALARKAGIPPSAIERHYQPAVLEQADKYRRVPLHAMIERYCAAQGVQLPDTIGSAEWFRAAWSTVDLPGILGAVANKAIGAVFSAANPTVPRVARSVSHSNFHTHTAYSLAASGEFEELPPGGELNMLSLGEESYTRRVKTSGALVTLTRDQIINDELEVFTRMGEVLARKALTAREKALYKLINGTGSGSSFFTAARGNYLSGASSALGPAGLSAAVAAMRKMKDPSGNPLFIEPRILLVPPELEETARGLMDRTAQVIMSALGATNAAARTTNANVWAGQFEIVVSPMLSDSSITGASATAWYLLAAPSDVPCFEIAYLNGVDVPTVEYFDMRADVSRLGVSYRVYWDFGAALAEYRGGVKSAGA